MDIVERLAQCAENYMRAEEVAIEAKYEIELLKEEVQILKTGLENIKQCICYRGDEEDKRDHMDDFVYMATCIVLALSKVRE
jgi:hypothetical protein